MTVAWGRKAPKPAWNWWDPEGKELVTQWRTTPVAIDWDRDERTDLVMLDHEGHVAFYRRRADGDGGGLLQVLPCDPERRALQMGE